MWCCLPAGLVVLAAAGIQHSSVESQVMRGVSISVLGFGVSVCGMVFVLLMFIFWKKNEVRFEDIVQAQERREYEKAESGTDKVQSTGEHDTEAVMEYSTGTVECETESREVEYETEEEEQKHESQRLEHEEPDHEIEQETKQLEDETGELLSDEFADLSKTEDLLSETVRAQLSTIEEVTETVLEEESMLQTAFRHGRTLIKSSSELTDLEEDELEKSSAGHSIILVSSSFVLSTITDHEIRHSKSLEGGLNDSASVRYQLRKSQSSPMLISNLMNNGVCS